MDDVPAPGPSYLESDHKHDWSESIGRTMTANLVAPPRRSGIIRCRPPADPTSSPARTDLSYGVDIPHTQDVALRILEVGERSHAGITLLGFTRLPRRDSVSSCCQPLAAVDQS
jgi:hypothetical protein